MGYQGQCATGLQVSLPPSLPPSLARSHRPLAHSLAEILRIWQGMLLPSLRLSGFNLCSPGILLALGVWAVHETRGSQNLMRIPGMRIFDIGKMLLGPTSYGTHILICLLICAACKQKWCTYFQVLAPARLWRAGLTCPDLT